MARRRSQPATLTPVIIFAVMAFMFKIPALFVFATFFFVRFLMTQQTRRVRERQPKSRFPQRPHHVPQEIPRKQYRSRANPFKATGIKKYKEYDMDGAIIDFQQGLKIDPRDIALHFNIAAAYSLTEDKEKGFYHLAEAVKNGFKDFDKIMSHDDLAYLRIQPEFEEFKANGFKYSNRRKIAVREEEVKDDVLLSQLNKLAEMRKKGLLSQAEFAMEKEKLLRR